MPEDLGDIEVTREQITIDQTGSIAVINNKGLAGALKSKLDEVREQEADPTWELAITFKVSGK